MTRLLRLLALLALLGLVLYPLVWMVSTSFKPDDEIVGGISLLPKNPTLANYPAGWSTLDVSFGRFFANSAFIAGATVVANCASCLLAATAVRPEEKAVGLCVRARPVSHWQAVGYRNAVEVQN